MTRLTEAQYTALATDITQTNSAEFAALVASGDYPAIAAAYSAAQVPEFWVWRTDVTRDELLFSRSSGDTVFTFVGNGYITRTMQELTAFDTLFSRASNRVNVALPQVRAAFTDIFSGAGNAALNRTHLLNVSRRPARRIERLFATGVGGPAPADIATMSHEGALDHRDIAHALAGVPLL